MAKAADQFRSSDVTVWGIVVIACWGAAVIFGSISAVVPPGVLAGLHASRLDGGTVNQLREQLASVLAETDRMRKENNLLLQRFDMAEQSQGQVARRVGALEISLPRIAERVPETAAIDQEVTASIADGKAMTYDAEGGTVTVVQKPLIAIQPGVPATTTDGLDAASAAPNGVSYGVALGFPIAPEDGEVQWQGLLAKVGALLIGLEPVIADAEGSDGKIVIAGPFETRMRAGELCERLDKVGIPCKPVPFKGEPLPLLN